jgi:methionyl-tRNA formyltransferase
VRVGILTSNKPRGMHVANTLCDRVDVRCIVVEDGYQRSWRAIRRALKPANLHARFYRMLRCHLFPPDCDPARFFFGDAPPHFNRPELVRRVPHINNAETIAALEAADVELLAVFGTSLLRNAAFFEHWPERMLNLHGGLSPWYRGADSTFWALFNGEPERIGCTVHRISPRIDAGVVLAHACPAVHPGDREEKLFCRTIAAGADLLAEVIERTARGEPLGRPQPPGGRLYLARHRRYRHDRALTRRFAAGAFDEVRLPARQRWYTQANESGGSLPEDTPQRRAVATPAFRL